MDLVEKITGMIEPSLNDMGYEVVLVRLLDGQRRKTLTIMAERKDGVNMGFNDCTSISRVVGALLEVEDPISGAYNLEVCSPGLDRPLTRPEDFSRYAGNEIKLETQLPIDGRKRFRGTLKGIDKNIVTIHAEAQEIPISFNNIRSAKLMTANEFGSEKQSKQKHRKHQ